jgi:ABC-type transporter Mla subunit MlaD
MKITRSLISGVAIGAVLIGGVAFAVASTRMTGSGTHEITIDFQTADGLVSGSDVLVAGAKVGYISDIGPTLSGRATVKIEVSNDHWPLHQGLAADIRPKSLLGEKYVDLHDGSQTAAVYDVNQILHALPNAAPVELDQFINSLDPATRTAVRVLLDDLGAGVASKGHDLNTAIAAGKADLANFAVFGQTLNDRDIDLDRILVGLDGVLSKLTTSDQLTQMSQLISNGQNVLNDIETVQTAFSRQFTDANVALADLNTALGRAVPSLRTTLDIAPALVSNLQQEAGVLAALGSAVTGSANLSPHGECTVGSPAVHGTSADQPIGSITGLAQCSPLWEIINGLLGGATVSGGAFEREPKYVANILGTSNFSIFRVCILGLQPQNVVNACDTPPPRGAHTSDQTALFTAFLGT